MLVDSGANEITVAGSTTIGGGPPSVLYVNGADPASVDGAALPEEPVVGGVAEPPEAEVLPVLAGMPLPAPLTEATDPDVALPVPATLAELPPLCRLPEVAVVVPLREPPPPLLAPVAPGLAEHAARATQPQSAIEYNVVVM